MPRLIEGGQTLAQMQERADATREPANPLIRMWVEGRETGDVWPHLPIPGPLDGRPRRDWWAVAEYADGTRREWGPTKR